MTVEGDAITHAQLVARTPHVGQRSGVDRRPIAVLGDEPGQFVRVTSELGRFPWY